MPNKKDATHLPQIYAWFTAITSRDTDTLERLLRAGVAVDCTHPLRHSTALMEATRIGYIDIVQWLLDNAASPDILSGLPLGSPLHCALRRKEWEIATLLAKAMPNCAMMDAYGATPLHILCSESIEAGQLQAAREVSEILVLKHCPLNALDHEGTTALHHCVISDLYDIAAVLLAHGANPNALIPDSRVSPLTIAALERNLRMGQLLIEHGADARLRTRDGQTPASILPALGRYADEWQARKDSSSQRSESQA